MESIKNQLHNMGISGLSSKPLTERQRIEFEIKCENEIKGDDTTDLDCALCLNRKQFAQWSDEEDRIIQIPCKCIQERKNIRRLRISGLQEKAESSTFELYKVNDEWQKKLKETALLNVNCDNWFFLGGQTGIGKTHLCTAMCLELMKQSKDVFYMKWRDEIGKLRAFTNTPESLQLIEKLKESQVLYLDDFFKTERGQVPTRADIQTAYEIINHRYNRKLKTIISTELMIQDIIEIDEAIAGRIAELCTFEFCFSMKRDIKRNKRFEGFGFTM